MINWLKSKNSKVRNHSLGKALISCLDLKQVERLGSTTLTGDLVTAAAKELNLASNFLFEKVSKKLGVRFIQDLSQVSDEQINLRMFASLSKLGMLPFDLGSTLHVAASDPTKIKDVISLHNVPIMASRDMIASRIQSYRSSSIWLSRLDEMFIWFSEQAKKHSLDIISFDYSSSCPRYSFKKMNSIVASGLLKNIVKDDIIDYLNYRLKERFKEDYKISDFESLIFYRRPKNISQVETKVRQTKILIVEDNQSFAIVLKRYLKKQGLTVISAQSVLEAQQALNKYEQSLLAIVCDLKLGEDDGRIILDGLRAKEQTKFLPFIVLSSTSATEDKLELIEKGADVFLSKNDDPRLIVAYLQRMLERAGLVRNSE